MAIKEKDIKLLWSRSAGRCAICKIVLSQDKKTATETFPFGDQAHIVAHEPNGPRGSTNLTPDERDSYSNLILLCPNHHRIIDNDVNDFPVEKLHQIKSDHEIYVMERFADEPVDNRKVVNDLIYASLIDAASELLNFSKWEGWASWAFSEPPSLVQTLYYGIEDFQEKIVKAIWPGTIPELESALKTLSLVLMEAKEVFFEHAILGNEKIIRGIKFYNNLGEWNPERYKELSEAYDKWASEYRSLMFEATKAANWVAELVRLEINPMFFATQGKFMLRISEGLSFGLYIPEFTAEEKATILEQVHKRIEEKRKKEYEEIYGDFDGETQDES